MLTEFIKSAIDWYMLHINYGTVGLFMAIESTVIPFPSELIVPPAAWKAANGEMNIYLIFLASTIGALVGSLFNYYVSKYIGRALVYKFVDTKFAHFIFLNREKIDKSMEYFNKNGNTSIFIGRLLPVIRHLISIPAGLANMDIKKFVLYTTLGAGLWNIILCILGYVLFSQRELLNQYFKEITYVLIVLGVLFVIYLVVKNRLSAKKSKTQE